ncbi:hydantoinase B/oxoprolinase family protein [Actinoallomurus sp. NPDC052274]|uniref:hydantoinase B/oxoprolinase family protein n=1 Tax=Actinoallomurus sp. NPDC052274 TaxID=3155420 RepID=UPI003440CF5A
MNNVTFGDDHRYYETVSGASGAGDGFDGASIAQTHMTRLAGHRRVRPYGTAGGGPGGVGRQRVGHAAGSVTTTRGCDSLPVGAEDVFVVETPGGGGHGHPDPP